VSMHARRCNRERTRTRQRVEKKMNGGIGFGWAGWKLRSSRGRGGDEGREMRFGYKCGFSPTL